VSTPRTSFQREIFETPRVSEYFSARELTMLTGQPRAQFAAVLEKELGDNGLDAAETAGVPPELSFQVRTSGKLLTISVADNGPGLHPEILEKVLDFTVRASDKAAYRSPTRGAQGNALKTVVGIPHALGGVLEPIVIEACGVRHEIRAWLDPADELHIEHTTKKSSRKAGTLVSVTIPSEHQALDAVQWARAMALFNPHALVKIDAELPGINHARTESYKTREIYKPLVKYPEEWTKWLPSDPIPARWFDEPSLQRLIFLTLAKTRRDGNRDLPLGEFIRQFRGLSSTAKAREIAGLFPQIHRLADFEEHEDDIGRLLNAMQERSRPVPAKALGLIGEAQFKARFEQWYGVKRFWYAKQAGETAGLPIVMEVALGEIKQQQGQHRFFGLNFSPTFGDPFSQTPLSLAANLTSWGGVSGALSQAHVGDFPHVFALHVTSPAFQFRDRGKSTIVADDAEE
jgi:DNA topoisomerase VI subunit B